MLAVVAGAAVYLVIEMAKETGTDLVAGLFPEPVGTWVQRGILVGTLSAGLITYVVTALRERRRDRERDRGDVATHFYPRARGVTAPTQDGYFFQGRRRALEEINDWLEAETGPRVMVVTGSPGVGKSALLGHVVCTSDPRLRKEFSRRPVVLVPAGSVSSDVHARGMTPQDVATEVARDAGAEGPTTPEGLLEVLATQLRGKQYRFTVVVDALDEAQDPRAVIRDVLLPLVTRTDRALGVRLLVGTRHEDEVGELPAALGRDRVVLDLDRGEFFEQEDLYTYVLARLQSASRENAHDPYRHAGRAKRVAEVIARRANGNFLIAGLTALRYGLADAGRADPDSVAVGSNASEAVQQLVGGLPPVGDASAQEVLLPLAYAATPGLPPGLWRVLIRELTGKTVSEDGLARFLKGPALNLLVATTDGATGSRAADEGETVYRLFHEELNASIREERSRDRRAHGDQGTITAALLGTKPEAGWRDAPHYTKHALPGHATEAGMIDRVVDVLDTTDYVLHADLTRLRVALDRHGGREAKRYRDLIGQTPQAAGADPGWRAAAFSLTEAWHGSGQRDRRYVDWARTLGAPYSVPWVTDRRPTTIAQVLTGHSKSVRVVASTPDGSQAVTAGWDGTVRFWDLTTGAQERVLSCDHHHTTALTLTAGGEHVVWAYRPGGPHSRRPDELCVRNAGTGSTTTLAMEGFDRVRSIDVTPDRALVVGGDLDGNVGLWSLETGRLLKTMTGHKKWVRALAVTPDGRWVVTCSEDATARVWDLGSGAQLHVLAGHRFTVEAVAISPDGSRAVTGGSDGAARVWDLVTGAELHLLRGYSAHVTSVAFSADGHRVVTGGAYGRGESVQVWSLTGDGEPLTLTGSGGSVAAVALTPDGRHAVTGGRDGLVRVWDLDDDPGLVQRPPAAADDALDVISVGAAPAGKLAVTGSTAGPVQVWNLETGAELHRLTGHTDATFMFSLTRDGARAVTAGRDGTVRAWDLLRGLPCTPSPGTAAW